MATIRGRVSLNEVELLEVDTDPSAGSGTVAPKGSMAFTDSGEIWNKRDTADTAWSRLVNEYNDPNSSYDTISSLMEDWMSATVSGNTGFAAVVSNTGASSMTAFTPTNKSLGVCQAQISGNDSGCCICDLSTTTSGVGLFNLQQKTVTCDINFQPVFTNNNFTAQIGLGSTTGRAENVNGCYIFFSNANANWQCKTSSGSTRTTTNSGVAVTTATSYELKMIATTAQVLFYINNNLVATHTNNIPTVGLIRQVNFWHPATEGTSKQINIDYFYTKFILNAARL
jgi:hypothetical protein